MARLYMGNQNAYCQRIEIDSSYLRLQRDRGGTEEAERMLGLYFVSIWGQPYILVVSTLRLS